MAQRVLANPVGANLLDYVVARGRGVVCGGVGRPGEEPRSTGRVLHLLLERERAGVGLPARVRRLESLRQIGADV